MNIYCHVLTVHKKLLDYLLLFDKSHYISVKNKQMYIKTNLRNGTDCVQVYRRETTAVKNYILNSK